MDGQKVVVGDTVHDILLGTGTVESVNDDGSFVVAINTRRMTYQRGGMFSGVRRLYWRSPVMLIPPKHTSQRWDIIRAVVDTLNRELHDVVTD